MGKLREGLRVLGLLVVCLGLSSGWVWAQSGSPSVSGGPSGGPGGGPDKPDVLEIIKRSREIYQSKDQISTVTLRLIDKDKSERKIVTRRLWKNYAGQDGLDSKTLFWTEFPPDNRGTGFLIWDYATEGKPDDLWLYLPSLRQSRRMTTRDQDDAFMGSDLTFADMGQRRLDEDEHTLIGEGKFTKTNTPCYIVQSVPKEKNSMYSKKVSCISKDNWLTLGIDYYDRKGELLKTQTIEWQEKDGVYIYKEMVVKNVQTGHRTEVTFQEVEYNKGIEADLFSERYLRNPPRRWIR